ncbi:MAG: transposase [Candidatus Acidiferrum sp.]
MLKGLKRHCGQGDLHFITFCCYHRRRYLDTVRARNLFLKVLGEVRGRYQFRLIGYVLMPEHVHLLISEPKNGSVSRVLQVLKQRVSRTMRGKKRRASSRQLSLEFGDAMKDDRRFWQRRFYDFNVWSDAKRKEKLLYMHANPVRERLVKHPKEWPWSSFSFYAKDEQWLIRIDPVD